MKSIRRIVFFDNGGEQMKLVKNFEYVLCLANELNFSSAAEKLQIAQSSLTTAIKRIEEDLGFTIFDRSTNPISVTLAGQKYIEFIREFVLENNEIVQQCVDVANGDTKSIKIGIPHSLTLYLGCKVVNYVFSQYHNVEIELIEKSSLELVELLKNGEVDIIISTLNDSFNEMVEVVYKKREEFNLVVKKNGCFSKICEKYNDVVNLQDVSSLPFISLRDNQTLALQTIRMFADAGIDFHPKIKASCIQSVLALVKEDLGVFIVPDGYRCLSDLSRQCKFYKINKNEDEIYYREIVCAIRKNQYVTKPLNAIIAYLRGAKL